VWLEIRRRRLALSFIAFGLLPASPSAAQQPDRVRADTAVATAHRTTGTIHIDGRLLNASVTVNTDFAETEADIRQVNLTRFPLFFPEKRTFFLEGAGVFDVAGLAGGTDLIPFFTRRIGLHGDELTGGEVPIGVGAKIVGRQSDSRQSGRWRTS
jgi:hypothetical protein